MLPGITPAVHAPRFMWPDATWIGIADSTALIGGGSPLEAGMEVIAIGAAFNGSGSTPVVGVPSGWTRIRSSRPTDEAMAAAWDSTA
mgnify:CR=1 FL=1